MSVLPLRRSRERAALDPSGARLLRGFSIDVTPRSAAKIADFRPLLPAGTGITLAHVAGTLIDDMVAIDRGVGPSLQVLKTCARDAARLPMPVALDRIRAGIAGGMCRDPASLIAQVHLLPLGGIEAAAAHAALHGAGAAPARRGAGP